MLGVRLESGFGIRSQIREVVQVGYVVATTCMQNCRKNEEASLLSTQTPDVHESIGSFYQALETIYRRAA